MRLFQTERTQKDSNFVESWGFSLKGKVGFEHSGRCWAGKGITEETACAKAEYANASMCGSMRAGRSPGN